jgi:hypothetical protein
VKVQVTKQSYRDHRDQSGDRKLGRGSGHGAGHGNCTVKLCPFHGGFSRLVTVVTVNPLCYLYSGRRCRA